MQRAPQDRVHTVREWLRRMPQDEALQPGRFRKGRTAMGCPRYCGHCRAEKSRPSLSQRRADLGFAEQLRAA